MANPIVFKVKIYLGSKHFLPTTAAMITQSFPTWITAVAFYLFCQVSPLPNFRLYTVSTQNAAIRSCHFSASNSSMTFHLNQRKKKKNLQRLTKSYVILVQSLLAPNTLLFTHIHPRWPTCFSNIPAMLMPRGFCTYHFPLLGTFFLPISMYLPAFRHFLFGCLLQCHIFIEILHMSKQFL